MLAPGSLTARVGLRASDSEPALWGCESEQPDVMECRRMADGEAGATTSERGWATGTGQCLSRGPSPPNGLFHHPPPRSGFVQHSDSDAGRPRSPMPQRHGLEPRLRRDLRRRAGAVLEPRAPRTGVGGRAPVPRLHRRPGSERGRRASRGERAAARRRRRSASLRQRGGGRDSAMSAAVAFSVIAPVFNVVPRM